MQLCQVFDRSHVESGNDLFTRLQAGAFCPDALEGGFEDVLGVGFGVDDQGWGVGEVGVEWEVALVNGFHFFILSILKCIG